MKAIDFLDWAIKHGVSTEAILRTNVDKHFNCKEYCGYEPDDDLVWGEYAVVYSDAIDDAAFADLVEHAVCVYTNETDKRDGVAPTCIMFVILRREGPIMTCEERKQAICAQCGDSEVCGFYLSQERPFCEYHKYFMEGWQQGQQDTLAAVEEYVDKGNSAATEEFMNGLRQTLED